MDWLTTYGLHGDSIRRTTAAFFVEGKNEPYGKPYKYRYGN
jgi:hypothetical protein